MAINADIFSVDAWSCSAIDIAVNKIKLEVSGNINSDHLSFIKELDIDYISSADLTKNISATDYSLIFKPID